MWENVLKIVWRSLAIRVESRGTESGYPQCPNKLVQRYNEPQHHRWTFGSSMLYFYYSPHNFLMFIRHVLLQAYSSLLCDPTFASDSAFAAHLSTSNNKGISLWNIVTNSGFTKFSMAMLITAMCYQHSVSNVDAHRDKLSYHRFTKLTIGLPAIHSTLLYSVFALIYG